MKYKLTMMMIATILIVISCTSKKNESVDNGNAKSKYSFEISDSSYLKVGRDAMSQFVKGDIESWLDLFSEDAVYFWSNGDSLNGKKELRNYWTDRRANLIEHYTYDNEVWIPLNFKKQTGDFKEGIWLLSWYRATITYKNNKPLLMWIHNGYHFNKAGKIDRLIQFVDKANINKILDH